MLQQPGKPIFVARSDDSKNSNAVRHIDYIMLYGLKVFICLWFECIWFLQFQNKLPSKIQIRFRNILSICDVVVFLFTQIIPKYFVYDDAATQP